MIIKHFYKKFDTKLWNLLKILKDIVKMIQYKKTLTQNGLKPKIGFEQNIKDSVKIKEVLERVNS